VVTDFAKPIFRIHSIWFSPMHDGVPPTGFRCIDTLAQVMRMIEESIPEPDASKTAGCRIWINDLVFKKSLRGDLAESLFKVAMRGPWTKRWQLFIHKTSNFSLESKGWA
jgi:hypothetical protein